MAGSTARPRLPLPRPSGIFRRMSRRRRPLLTVIIATAVWLAAGGTAMRAQAAGGDLDTSFHGTGWTIGPESSGGADDMAVQADGKLVLTGRARAVAGGLRHLAVWRLH